MSPLPLLPLFFAAVVVVLIAIVAVLATDSWWAVATAFALMLAMLAVVIGDVLAYLRDDPPAAPPR